MSWTKIEGQALGRLNQRFIMPAGTQLVEASFSRPSFYKEGGILKLDNGVSEVFMVAAGEGDLFTLDMYPLRGVSMDIFRANEAAVLALDASTVLDYLRFFCQFLLADSGDNFRIVESVSGFGLIDKAEQLVLAPADMRLILDEGHDELGRFRCRGHVKFGDVLFESKFAVAGNGAVEMLEDNVIGRLVRLH